MKTGMMVFMSLGMFAFLLSGCIVYNLEPLYETKDLLTEPDLSGTWKSGGSEKLIFESRTDGTYSVVCVGEKGKKREYICGLIRLNGQFFIDATDESKPPSESVFIRARAIARVSFGEKSFKTEWLDSEWLQEQFSKGKLKVANVVREGNYKNDIILTASTKDLKKFIEKIANKDEAFASGGEYTRLK